MLNLMIIHFFGLITPGPDFFYVSRMAASNSRRNVTAGIFGITLGVAFWATAALLGLKVLFDNYSMSHGIIVLLGGSYLAYLGVLMAKSRKNVVFTKQTEAEMNQNTTVAKEIGKGMLVNLSNAKAIIYFASVMSGVLASITETSQILTALAIIIVETFFYFYVISVLFSRNVAKQFYSKYSRYVDNVAGVIFLFFGGVLIYSAIMEIFKVI
ncbi:RhtB (resistance to homoserine/threonine) family protein [Cricetibacter osteomyelitidis]|uniref:RhtB (Resistance to homoserine/threonine) family protein n=1 Tax=Cricetibacter osteomyelitidis TaxID=1521931 RepID=A0A4R2SZX2_9PAST|nr:LysE family transporter [Cricetibacter osteomyelitidis]TCP95125.1 RhtB (resistance to homoserine/threonine) family protein [Cricetibacter osteomyelitidis]